MSQMRLKLGDFFPKNDLKLLYKGNFLEIDLHLIDEGDSLRIDLLFIYGRGGGVR